MVAMLGIVLGACDVGTADTTTTSTSIAPTTTTTAPTTTTTEPPPPFIYRVGLAESPTTDNYWAYYDPQSSLVDQYVLEPTRASLYTYDQPDLDLAAELAGAEPPSPVEDGDTWTVTVPLAPDLAWSDGAPLTSGDVVFTYETVRRLQLGRGWATAYPEGTSAVLGLVAVEAPDPATVVFRFNGRPGLPFWPNGPGTAPIMPRHFWEPVLEQALAQDDPVTSFLTASAEGEPTAGPVMITEFQATSVTAAPNDEYVRTGLRIDSGGASYQVGPFFQEMVFQVFDGVSDLVGALDAGEVDVILTPSGIDRQAREFLASNGDVETIVNDTNGFRYLAFNLRASPMSIPGFREAVSLMIDREFVADEVLAGQATPVYATVPASNPLWFDETTADGFAAVYRDLTTEERLSRAVSLLEESGFAWEQRPAFVDNAVVAGSGITLDGEPVGRLRLLGPGPTFDPFRSTYTLWIDEWLAQLGFEVDVTLTDFSTLVSRAFTPTPAGTLDYDLYVLGWRLPSAAMPVYHESFWASKNETIATDGNNNTGFANDEFDALVEQYNAAETADEAFRLLWEMERIVFAEKPYIVLYDTPVAEAFRSDRVVYPFTDILSGLQALNGMPELVRPVP